jgi:hypothetical protein
MRPKTKYGFSVFQLTSVLRLIELGSVCALCSLTAFPQALQIQPPSISATSAGFTAEARIVLQNPGNEILRNVSLGYVSNDGITAELGKPSAAVAVSKGQIVWPARIIVPSTAHLPGTVIFDASYGTGKTVNHQYASIALQSDGAQKLIDATLDGTPDPVSQQRPSAVYLLITNNLDVPVHVCANPQSLSGGLEIPHIDPFQVPPHSTAARRVDLKTRFRVTPGIQTMALDVNVRWTRDSQNDQRSFTLTKPVTVGVFFESELLKALSIPSFLLLPGCLVIFTMQLMLSLGIMGLKNQSNLPSITIASPGFWILSISVSWLFVLAYYGITGVNCLLMYGLSDMEIIWVASIALGAGTYLAIAWRYQDWRRDHVFTSSDTPIQVLDKLGRNGLGPLLPRVKFKINDLEFSGFVIEKINEDQAIAWVAPHISVSWEDSSAAQALQKRFNTIMNGSRDPKTLADLFDFAGNKAVLTFETNGVVPNPYHLKLDAVTEYMSSDLIVG